MAEIKAEDYLGLTKKSCQDKAEGKNIIFRLISKDGEPFFSYPDDSDIRTDRICVELENGLVVKVTVK